MRPNDPILSIVEIDVQKRLASEQKWGTKTERHRGGKNDIIIRPIIWGIYTNHFGLIRRRKECWFY